MTKNIDKIQDSNNKNNSYFEVVSAEKIQEIINDKKYIIIDIRDIYELKILWTIADRNDLLNIVFNSENFLSELYNLDKNKKYIIYCNSWQRTQVAFEIMKKLWFNYVLDLEWWIQNWKFNKKYITFIY